ncbi:MULTISPECIES: hypothetical protein [Pseudomonas]|uniref:DUF1311 domain-containing protein n=1 Tax=Pseudomonas luteola TaxID=47886 RepID=A0A2X2CJC5_PSELU|nr:MULTISPECIES: hypothetical protein [Pseudomonas]MBW5414822.1 hypothetical protein [Pseudomonas sp. MAG002Y]RRW40587.1 hypothetical protein EGJ50_24315 [Pseudomonas luteola]SHJ76231.1 hypothetical protein SAMN05216295_1316 [Pseudomonas zeshuii]SPZ00275.1 Uncharacterised protein [Pseudomonas luteola]
MKRLLIPGLLLASMNASAGLYIDPQQLKDDQNRDKLLTMAIKKCPNSSFKTIGERDECRAKYRNLADQQFPLRGSKAYSEKKYSGLSKPQAEQQLIELKKIYDQADMFAVKKKPGELTQSDMEAEGWWIQQNILKATRTQGDPWFIECKVQKWKATVDLCPLGKGGNP